MLIGIATSSPPYKVPQAKAVEELKARMGERPAVARLIDAASRHSGIDSRYVVVPDASVAPADAFYPHGPGAVLPGTGRRMELYEQWARTLSSEAVTKLLHATHFDAASIQRLVTVSCTGFFAPGLDHHLMQEFGIPATARRTHIGFMGCAAALVGFSSVLEWLHAAGDGPSTTLLVAVELCSLHLQTEPTRDNILANMVFADGCAAALFSNALSSEARLKITSTHSYLFQNSASLMGWRIGNQGFEMTLSSELPKIIAEEAVPALLALCNAQGIPASSVRHWVLHPGGKAILDALQAGLHLDDETMQPSRTVLRDFGNMSSVSILFVLKELLATRHVRRDEVVCAVAFGPGLTMEVAFLRGV